MPIFYVLYQPWVPILYVLYKQWVPILYKLLISAYIQCSHKYLYTMSIIPQIVSACDTHKLLLTFEILSRNRQI